MLRRRIVWAALVVGIASCGGKVVVDGEPGSDEGTTDGSGGTTGTGDGGGVTTPTTTFTTTSTVTGTSCGGQICGTFCDPCASGCIGHCDGAGTCVSEVDGGTQCPPPSQVLDGVACGTEGFLCASDASCSGYLECLCGHWTLINPC